MRPSRYSIAAIFLHWLVAAALAFQLALGWRLDDVPKGPPQFAAYQLHKSVGIAILLLVIVRLALRLLKGTPAALADSRLGSLAAKSVHVLLYAAMLSGPLTGWALVSTAKVQVPTLLFGAVPWPHLPIGQSLAGPLQTAHGLIAFGFVALILAHFAGAARHQLVKREALMARILPWLPGAPALVAGLTIVLAAAGVGMLATFGSVPLPVAVGEALPVPASLAESSAAEPTETTPTAVPGATTAAVPLATWEVSPGGRLGFRAISNGSAIDGSFARWTAQIRFSPDDLAGSSVKVHVDIASAGLGDPQQQEMLRGPDFLDSAAHPGATFTATGFRALNNDRYEARGALDLHGRSQQTTLRFALKLDGDTARASGSTRLDRTAFGVGSGDWVKTDEVAASVDVTFNLVAVRQDSRSRVPGHP